MKISDIKTYLVANPPPSRGGGKWVIIKLTTDDGIVGWGEAYDVRSIPR
jgi:L-alanine-DL-glutamate epimerase-like enolase superfamily enzyme